MSSKRHSDVLGVGRKAKRQRQRRHLYFVVDDGDGYAIRKMDLSSEYESDDDAARHEDGEIETVGAAWSPLPEALIRLPAQTGEFFVASGTKILVTDCGWPEHAVPVFDVHSRSLTLGPRPHSRTCPHTPIYMPVGRNVVSVDAGFAWSWDKLADKPPFRRVDVTCHAAHPDGRTLFVSTVNKGAPATFTLDTGAEDGVAVWKQRGRWKLPFKGQALFDPALDAWVGLSGDKDTLGHLCSSDVPPVEADDAGSEMAPLWRLSKEKMLCGDPGEEHLGADLVYMGGRSKFCILQCFSIVYGEKDDDHDDEGDPYQEDDVDVDESDRYKEKVNEENLPRRHLLQLITFTLKDDKNGQLTTAKRRRVRCFELLRHADPLFDDIRAFWI
ncbi:hypothetical protein CFC21_068010 [Triticum aestivum]|uniref:DUF1618 domain-containing protein n=2 Tax=Triticum aestivum TaxID=4565 RepID=A0A9R1HAZ1_WHEAT|nr:hypothetical protein CFC21_068010 [Triticum aestivum]